MEKKYTAAGLKGMEIEHYGKSENDVVVPHITLTGIIKEVQSHGKEITVFWKAGNCCILRSIMQWLLDLGLQE